MEGLRFDVGSDKRKHIYLTDHYISLIFSKHLWYYGKTFSETDFNLLFSKIESIINSEKLSFVLNLKEGDFTGEYYYIGKNTLILSLDSDDFTLSLYNVILDVRRYVGIPSGNFPNYSSEPMDNSERVLLLNRINKYIKEYLKDD